MAYNSVATILMKMEFQHLIMYKSNLNESISNKKIVLFNKLDKRSNNKHSRKQMKANTLLFISATIYTILSAQNE